MRPSRRTIEVVEYDARWPALFAELRDRIWPCVADICIAIEHVGSTSVPGLTAKPVIDIDVVIPSREKLPEAIACLARLGYARAGNLGIEDRESFSTPEDGPAHHLYVCPSDSLALRNHLALRDHLRAHPEDVARYSALKKKLAESYPQDIDSYIEGKSEFILSILAQYDFTAETLDSIRRANRK